MTPLKAPKSMKACEAMLTEIEAELLATLPQAVRQRNFKEPAYGVVICYVDLSAEKHVPYPTVLWESHLSKCIANREVEDIWFLPEIANAFPCLMPESETLGRRCELVYDYLTENSDDDEEQIIMPFRKMIYRVSLILNRLDWSKILPVTDDFIVMASDWNSSRVREDAKQSVPAAKQGRLKKKGLFFNPHDLPEPVVPASCPIREMDQRPVAEQIPYWTKQLEALIEGKACDAKRAKWGPQLITRALYRLGEPGSNALLTVVEKFADLPESKDGKPCRLFQELAPHSAILCDALKLSRSHALPDNATEKRLWSLFDRTLKVNEGWSVWGELPGVVAHCIKDLFDDKYDFWVIRDDNRITNLDKITAQRKARAPK